MEVDMSQVFVLDTEKRSQDPMHPGRARLLLKEGKAAVFRRYPFTIILKAAKPDAQPAPLRVKVDPGSRASGLAVVDDATGAVVWAAAIAHRGQQVHLDMLARAAVRKGRRRRKTRYRPARFNNRTRPEGWLAPSLESRVANITTWVARLMRFAPIGAVSMELVRFDTQKLQDPEISGVKYQQGDLEGYEVREYLLEKWGRECAYCGVRDVPLQVEHIVLRARHGSNRVSNLTIACEPCNKRKGTMTAAEFGFPHIQARAKEPLHDAAAVNTTRFALYRRLCAPGLPVETGSGGMTKWNRCRRGLPKTHWLDAACVGQSTPEVLRVAGVRPLLIMAMGHGTRKMCNTNGVGFPISHRTRRRSFLGWRTGDIVQAVIPKGKYAGTYTGRIAIRQKKSFKLRGFDVHPKYLRLVQRVDGYTYALGPAPSHDTHETKEPHSPAA